MKTTDQISDNADNYPMIRNRILSLVFILQFVTGICFSNNGLNEQFIIDTDCGENDFHAINFLLSRPEIEIAAFVVSEGTLKPEDGIVKIKSLLKDWNADSIPAICNSLLVSATPTDNDMNHSVRWGSQEDDMPCNDDMKQLKILFERDNTTKYTLICLGSLSTAYKILDSHPEYVKQIRRIIWYNESAKPLQGYNYDLDRIAADKILASDVIRVDIISNLNDGTDVNFDDLLHESDNLDNRLFKIISGFHKQKALMKCDHHEKYVLKDELATVYILNPELFVMNIDPAEIWIRFNESYNIDAVREVITDLLTGSYRLKKNVVFNEFPSDRKVFNYDVRQIMDAAITRHGENEWKACVITDEFHGHLGVFSIVGAKMGIKARDIFQVGPDNLSVISYAGTLPPYSCLNDGIQVSTGATLGQGTISVIKDTTACPEAIFTCGNQSVRIKLKDEYLDLINKDIQEGIVKFGMADDGYWKLIRSSALRYWLEWSRDEIFDITVL